MEQDNKTNEPAISQDTLATRVAELDSLLMSMISHFGEKTDATNGSILEIKNSLNLFMPIFLGMSARIQALEDRLGGGTASGSQQTSPSPNNSDSILSLLPEAPQEVEYQERTPEKIHQQMAKIRAKAFPHLNRPSISPGSSHGH